MASLTVTVSGSFHRHMTAIREAVEQLTGCGAVVLSPADPRVVGAVGPFLFVASDAHRSVRLVQDRHLAAISNSDFVWLVCPDGYVGQSASLEIGFALARGVPVLSLHWPNDLTLRQYVQKVESVEEAILLAAARPASTAGTPSLLLDPSDALGAAHDRLEQMRQALLRVGGETEGDVSQQMRAIRQELLRLVGVPTRDVQ